MIETSTVDTIEAAEDHPSPTTKAFLINQEIHTEEKVHSQLA